MPITVPASNGAKIQVALAAATAQPTASWTLAAGETALMSISRPSLESVNSISDAGGRTWTYINGISGDNCRMEFWRCHNSTASAQTGTTTINTNTATKNTVVISASSGVDSTNPMGTTATSSMPSTTAPTVSLNLNAAEGRMFAGFGTNGAPAHSENATVTDTIVGTAVTSGGGGATNTRGTQAYENTANGTAGQTLTVDLVSSFGANHALVGVELRPGAGTPPPSTANTGAFFALL